VAAGVSCDSDLTRQCLIVMKLLNRLAIRASLLLLVVLDIYNVSHTLQTRYASGMKYNALNSSSFFSVKLDEAN
jgi:hypothetical protein